MIPQLLNLLGSHRADVDGIYVSQAGFSLEQSDEIALRERVAAVRYDDYLGAISQCHSIPVMDHEVDRFLAKIPQGGVILDIGGCWGWHWRRLAQTRPDVGVLIIDLVRSNLPHAQNILGGLVGHQVALMHADATRLPFVISESFSGFSGVWTVQTFQHIPDFKRAVSEAFRVLKVGGIFANYSLNIQPPVRLLYQLLGRKYVSEGEVDGLFWLARASNKQKKLIESIFGNAVSARWSEILFSPELHFPAPGKQEHPLGRLDSLISNNAGFLGWFARQRSFHCRKP